MTAIWLGLLSITLSIALGILLRKFFLLKKAFKKYAPIQDLQKAEENLRNEIEFLQKNEMDLQKTRYEIQQKISELREELTPLDDEIEIQSFGVYEPLYDFKSSDEYKDELDKTRTRQKTLIKNKNAVICHTDWHVGGSKHKGQTMTNEQIKLMLRAFNGEADALIMKVSYNNIERIKKRIESLYVAINKLGKTSDCEITSQYLDLKISELHLVHEYQEEKQAELEEQRQIREQMREEERAQRELERAQIEAEKEETRYQKALEKATKDVAEATGDKQAKLQEEIRRLNELLAEAQSNKERAKSRAEMTRSGYVYIISNIGSFGEDVYKIGMTRRLEPMDRVKELGDASVPFQFDVHAMVFAKDAPGLENELHQTFSDRRVNRVNERKEFFKVSVDEIHAVIRQYDPEAKFTKTAVAEEYRKTQAIIKKSMNGSYN